MKEEKEITNSKFQIRLPLLLSLTLSIGILIGSEFFGNRAPSTKKVNVSVRKFGDILNYIQEYYVDTVDINELTEYAIKQMFTKLDPHTVYIPKEDTELVNSQLRGDFEGVGIEFNVFRDTVTVMSVIEGGPSAKAGLKSGDRILMVDEDTIAGVGITNDKIVHLLRGEKGSKVLLMVMRKGEEAPMKFTVSRGTIPTQTVDVSYMVNPEIGYIKISRFGIKTYDEFKVALDRLKREGMQKLILDLRDNGGGYLDKAVQIADEFLQGDELIVYTDGKNDQFDARENGKRKGDFESGDLIVLINESSASASEVLSGALQDNDRALIVGRRSFGKGLVQRQIGLIDNSQLRLTISRYYTPSGRSIQKPYEVEQSYQSDLSNRYQHGEYFHVDSIKFSDSLKYETTNGRAVYGGGGIMPDYFVPLDTSFYTPFLGAINQLDLIRSFALDFANERFEQLEKMGIKKFAADYKLEKELLRQFLTLVRNNEVSFDEAQYAISENFISNRLKAFVARTVWGDAGFYQIFQEHDEIFRQALTLIKDDQAFLSLKK
ncbi:S41 family peptidase [Rapidithrix thailandica]|uniref:S41 family peptidase n=1 Tax=Rapidithrix thailandica TaxID=413964 RepID=A0AAW9SCH9_9BACT